MYYKTMYTLKWVYEETKSTRQQAGAIVKEVGREGGREGVIYVLQDHVHPQVGV